MQSVTQTNLDIARQAHSRLASLTMPHWALGRLMDLAKTIAGITRSLRPSLARKVIVTMAADHGVVAEGVSKYPQEVTAQMVANFVAGGAGINALARQGGAEICIVDMGVAGDLRAFAQTGTFIDKKIAAGTENMARGPAMTRAQAIGSIEAGIDVVSGMRDTMDIVGTGDMGIGNTTPSAAIAALITGKPVAAVTGRGTGIDDGQRQHKIAVIEKSLALNRPDAKDPLDVLAKVGGFEIGGIAGVILGAAAQGKPILIDGFISTAGAFIAQGLCPRAMDYVIAAHRSVEPGHNIMLDHLNKQALLDLDLRLGEGTGAALAMNLADAAVAILTEVATFEEAQVAAGTPSHNVEI